MDLEPAFHSTNNPIANYERIFLMAKPDNNLYVVVRDKQGGDLLCPISDDSGTDGGTGDDQLNCFEKDVAERYSGNIIIVA